MMVDLVPLIQDIYLEMIIVLLAGWALWKSLPRDPCIEWDVFGQAIQQSLSDQIPDGAKNHPLMLLEWDQVRLHDTNLYEILQRRLSGTILVGTDSLTKHWGEWLGCKHVSTFIIDDPTSWTDTLETVLDNTAERFVIIAQGTDCQVWLEYLHRSPAVRDFTSAVIFLAPELRQEWLTAHFDHDQMDVEANISVPYFVLSQSSETCISTPAPNSMGWKALEIISIHNYLDTSFN